MNALFITLRTIVFASAFVWLWGSVALFSALWLAAAHLFVVMYEERRLRKTFESSYERYLHTVPRWLPRT